jgi:hypothetical protein
MIINSDQEETSWEVIMDTFKVLFRNESSAEMPGDSLFQAGSRILCRKHDSGLCELLFFFLGLFAKLRKAAVSFVISGCMSACKESDY